MIRRIPNQVIRIQHRHFHLDPSLTDVLILDTETTGFLPRGRMIQLAWRKYNSCGSDLISQKSYLIAHSKPLVVPKSATDIHGFTAKDLKEHGVHIDEACEEFAKDLLTTKIVVGHNLNFDLSILYQELDIHYPHPKILSSLQGKLKVCTMINGPRTKTANLKSVAGKGRFIGLKNMYQMVVGEVDPLLRLHNADADVLLTSELYFALLKLKDCEIVPRT